MEPVNLVNAVDVYVRLPPQAGSILQLQGREVLLSSLRDSVRVWRSGRYRQVVRAALSVKLVGFAVYLIELLATERRDLCLSALVCAYASRFLKLVRLSARLLTMWKCTTSSSSSAGREHMTTGWSNMPPSTGPFPKTR